MDAGNLQEAEEAAVASHAAALRDGAAKRTQEFGREGSSKVESGSAKLKLASMPGGISMACGDRMVHAIEWACGDPRARGDFMVCAVRMACSSTTACC